jgi:Flp pilus assembly protein TadD
LRATLVAILALFLLIVVGSFVFGIRLLYWQPQAPQGTLMPRLAPEEISARLRAADEHLRRGEAEQAILTYRELLAVAPSLNGQLGLARGELLAGRQDVAAQEFERAVALDPRNPTALLELARIYSRRAPSWPDAERRYRAYITERPDDAQAQLDLGRLLIWQGKALGGVELLAQPSVQKLMTSQDKREYAFALVKAGREGEAQPILEGISSQGKDDDAMLQLAGLHASRGQWSLALPLYRRVSDHRPADPQVNRAYGLGLLAAGDAAGALLPLEKAVDSAPQDGEAALGYARALRQTGDLKKASQVFDRAISKFETDAGVNREYGDLLLQRREYGKARSYYRRAMSLGLRDDRILVSLGACYSATDEPREAVPLLEEAYRQKPSDRLALDLAKLYKRVGRSDRALEMLRMIDTSPTPPSR